MATASLAIALFVGFLPLGIEKLRARRAAKPIQVVASPGGTEAGLACRQPDSTSVRLIADTRQLAGAPDSAWRAMREELEIPRAEPTAVMLVRDERICRNVLAAFNATLPESWPSRPPASLYVVKAGDVYIAMAPKPPGGSVDVYAVTDAGFEVLSKFAR